MIMSKKYILSAFLLFLFILQIKGQNVIISPDSTSFPEVELDEVIIIASKNNSRLKELPASVSIILSSVLEQNEIKSLNQVSTLSPNFVMPDYGSKLTSPVYIRGIGSRIKSPSVGLYVDNIPYFEKSVFEFDFFDIERIEILRGPQGTLYGRNSMGGLINIITQSPVNYQGTHIKLSAANYGSYKANAGHYMKLNKDFAFSLSGNYRHNDGFYNNEFSNNRVDELNSFGLRNRLIYNVPGKLTIENIAGIEQSKQGGYPYSIYNDSLQTAEAINYNQNSSYNRLMFSDALNLKYSGKNWELTNTLSYQYLDDIQNIDQDFTPDSLYFIEQLQNQNMVAEELIIRSNGNKTLNWLFGGFGFIQLFQTDVEVDVYRSDLWYVKTYDADVHGLAFFHQSRYKITDNFSITAGIRYDHETSGLKYKYNALRADRELPKTDTIYPDLKDHILLPKFAFNYQFKNTSIYASYTTGYKPGGFNSTFERPEHLMFKNEISHNYETGIKTSFFQNYIYTDIALFYTRLKNQQIYRTVPSGRGSYLDNAGVSENKGIEISLKSIPINGFEGLIAYGYAHSKILEYVKDTLTNYNNNFTPYIPRHTLAVQITQTLLLRNLSFIDKLKMNVLYNQNGIRYWNLDNTYKENRYGLLNAKISIIRKKVQFDIWGKNLLNTKYHAFLFEALGNTYVQAGRPVQVGLNVSVNF